MSNLDEKAIRQKLKDDFIHYASKCLKIRTKSGSVEPFALNKAQKYIHARLEAQKAQTGKVRALILKGRQQGCCFSEHMRVLTSDYRWIKIKDVRVGEILYALDEEPLNLSVKGRKTDRKICLASVEAKVYFRKEALELTLSNGVKLEVTADHRMLFKQRGGCLNIWRTIGTAKEGDYIRSFSAPPESYEPTYEDGWFAGLLDGEGSFGCYPAARISVSQVEGAVLQRAKRYLEDRGIRYYELIDKRTRCGQRNKLGDKPVHCIRIDRQADIIKILTMTRPSRFISRPEFVGKSLPNSCDGFDAWVKIESIRSIGTTDVIDLQTSAKTFICEGLVSHNSTYDGGRFYHQVSHHFGMQAFILTHALDATQNLYKMAQRYYENTPDVVKPQVTTSNSKELIFGLLDSGYKLGTAENKAVGRSATIQLLHGSEIGFWNNAAEHAKGFMQAVPSTSGTEIILESTANGVGNFFHQQWQQAEAGLSDYIAIFVPWYWQDEYKREIDDTFSTTAEEDELMFNYGLSVEQIAWRRYKVAEFAVNGIDGNKAFMQEYPCTSIEAFQTTGEDTYISSEIIMHARKAEAEKYGKLVIGVDPARFGDDRTAIIRRQGRVAYDIETHIKKDTMEVVGLVNTIIEQEKPFKVFVDVGGLGAGVVDRLKELGHKDIIVAVNAGSKALDAKKYYNKRAEMWGLYRQWLLDEPCKIPDNDALHADSCGIRYKVDSNSRLVMEQKAEMKKRGVRSSDCADALCLTFAYPETALQDSNTTSNIAAKILSGQKSALRARSNLYGGHQNS